MYYTGYRRKITDRINSILYSYKVSATILSHYNYRISGIGINRKNKDKT